MATNSPISMSDCCPDRSRSNSPHSNDADNPRCVQVFDDTDVEVESLVQDSVPEDSLLAESIFNESFEVSTRSLSLPSFVDPVPNSQIALSAIVASWIQTKYQDECPETRRELFEDLANQFGTVGLNFEAAVSSQFDSQRNAYMNTAESYAEDRLTRLKLQGSVSRTELVASDANTPVQVAANGDGTAGLGGPQVLRRSVSIPEGSSKPRAANGSAVLMVDPAAAGRPPTFEKQSRLAEEYHVHEMIGKGGFGEVYKVVHKLDQACYALKKIRLKAGDFPALGGVGLEASKILNEIRTLARLDHVNIVRYFNSWIEHANDAVAPSPPIPAPAPATGLEPITEESTYDSDETESSIYESDESSNASNGMRVRFELEDPEIQFEDGSYSARDRKMIDASHIVFDGSKAGTTVARGKAATFSDENENESEAGSSIFAGGDTGPGALVRRGSRIDGPTITLHITMSLHPVSLTHYISPRSTKIHDRHCFCPLAALKIFAGIISGVDYLHSQGIVHRDLKPGNVFLNFGGPMSCCANPGSIVVPKIGDFGLVAAIDDTPRYPATTSASTLGTTFYSAPEGGRHPVVDVWALGVILLELLYKFGTAAERVFVLGNLTANMDCLLGIKQLALDERLASIIARCCSKEHKLRYTVGELKHAVENMVAELEDSYDHGDEIGEKLGELQLQDV